MSEDRFSRLDADLPLTLFPVRIEARYLPRRRPTHLFIRIFPDVIHAVGHRQWLTEREADAGKQYWTSIWGEPDAASIKEVRRWLAAQTGPHRALWVAATTRPTNLDSGDQAPSFPKLPVEARTEPVRAALLPDEWMVRLYDHGMQLRHTALSAPVTPDLPMAPALSEAGIDATHPKTGKPLPAPLAFLSGQDLLWTVDFEQAEAAGMGLRIAIDDVPDPVGALIVLGIRADRDAADEGARLDGLFEAHWYTRGLDLVPQGTPTNNTDAGRTSVSILAPDIDELFQREASSRPIAPAGRAVLIAVDPAFLYRLPSADSISLAFGRVRANAFDRVVHADWGEGAASWAMNVATGYGILGRYLSGPLGLVDGSIVTGDHTGTLRDWYVNWVRGGSLLPVLRCGEQPYGVLPITHRPAEYFPPADFEVKYEHYMTRLLKTWTDSLPAAALDPDATDGKVGGNPISDAAVIAEVLGGVPHPTALQLRRATDHLPEDTARLHELVAALHRRIDGGPHIPGSDEGRPLDASLIARFWDQRKRWIVGLPEEDPPVPPPDSATQLANLELFYREVQNAIDSVPPPHVGPSVLALIDSEFRPLFELHKEATDAIPEALWDWRATGGVGSDNVIRLVGTTFDETAERVHDLATSSGDIAEIRDTIEHAIQRLNEVETGNIPPHRREPLVTSPAPLLQHLLDVNYRTVDAAEVGPVRVALKVLLAMIDSPRVEKPTVELERLMRECLGLAMYRIDAWVTAIAAKRLAEKRRLRSAGAQIGAYGWLLDLKKSNDPASQGFIHAPSLSHAQSAAILRAGWNAYGTASGERPLSIDLSSARVRGAQWVLDGVRNGQDLAELLGARFERYLHDAHLDDWIETVRKEALAAKGSSRPPTRVVDGLLVARAASDIEHSPQEAALATALDRALQWVPLPQENARRRAVRHALTRLAADLDSVADLLMTQSVHSLLQDNLEAASAAIGVSGGADAAVPPITVTGTQRAAQLISHRVVAMWSAPPTDRSDASPVSVAEPRLVPWLEQLLPAAARVVAAITQHDESGTVVATETLDLGSLGLTAVEAALLAGSAATQNDTRLGRVVTAVARARFGTVNVDPAAPAVLDDKTVSVNEFGLIASALLEALGRSRPLRASDLVVPGTDVAGTTVDVRELRSRVTATEALLVGLINDLADADAVRRARALLCAAAFGIAGSVRAIEAGAASEATGPVIAALKARLEGRSTKTWSPDTHPSPLDPVNQAVDRLRDLTGGLIPILPVFTPVADPDRAASAGSAQRQQQITDRGHTWLRQEGRVRADVGALVDVLMLVEATSGPVGRYGLAQLPHAAEPWAAVGLPADNGDRLCIVSITGPESLGLEKEPAAGVLFDAWTEGIPRKQQQTAVALHFDAPTARPPQSVLLSVVDAERGFSADELADQLLFTIELAKLRALGPMDLKQIGHYLPAVFVPDDVVVSHGSSGPDGARSSRSASRRTHS